MNFRRRLSRGFGEPEASPDVPQEPVPESGDTSSDAVKRIETYVTPTNQQTAAEGWIDVEARRRAEEELPAAEPDVAADVAAVSEEVGTVLTSAHEAAARIRTAAEAEANRLQAEAQAAAAAEVATARRVAEDERAEAARLRTEAKAYVEDAHAAADAFAEQQRTRAAQEAAQIVGEAETARDAAAAEAEQTLREATADEKERLWALQAEIERHEERLETVLAAFRRVTTQLEDLLDRDETDDAAVSVDAGDSSHELETALRPESSSSPRGNPG
jgi:hypothetical protein